MPVKDCCVRFFFFLLFSSVTKDEHLVVDQRGKKEEKKQTEWILSRSRISPSFFSSLQVLDPEADVPRRLGPGHRVEGCGRSAELVLGLNLEVGGGMEVRVTVRLGSPLGQRVQPPQGAGKSGHCLPPRPVTEVSQWDARNSDINLQLLDNWIHCQTITLDLDITLDLYI